MKPPEDPLNGTQIYVILVSVATVGLWCFNSFIQHVTGEMGVLAILPLVAFFGFGVLDKDDFNGFLWNVVMLAMGGLALGEAVKSSGLLLTIATVSLRLLQVHQSQVAQEHVVCLQVMTQCVWLLCNG